MRAQARRRSVVTSGVGRGGASVRAAGGRQQAARQRHEPRRRPAAAPPRCPKHTAHTPLPAAPHVCGAHVRGRGRPRSRCGFDTYGIRSPAATEAAARARRLSPPSAPPSAGSTPRTAAERSAAERRSCILLVSVHGSRRGTENCFY